MSMRSDVLPTILAQRGDVLRCRGWRQESILRMLENTLENAEDPSRLIVYGGAGKAARNWESFHAIVDALKSLDDDHTLAIQGGMPVAVFPTHRLAPRVVMGLTNVIRAEWSMFYDLVAKNLTAFSAYTAGPWQYIGSQGVVEGTFETLARVADEHFGGQLKGRVLLTAGLGGMGKSQPFAMSMHGGISLVVEVRRTTIDQRLSAGYVDSVANDLPHAVRMVEKAKSTGRPLSVALQGNMADVCEEVLTLGWKPDIATEMCPCHDPFAVVPSGVDAENADGLRAGEPKDYLARSRDTMKRLLRAMNGLMDKGVVVFEYGTFIRKECVDAGMNRGEAFRYPGCVARYWRPMFEEGRGPFRWTCISGDVEDQRRLDELALDLFPDCPVVQRWIPRARAKLPIEGLPARVCFLGYGQRRRFGLAVNDLVKRGELSGPIAFSRDNLDSGSIANPAFETEDMRDGSDSISDWPYLNALLNTAAMADVVSIQANGTMGVSAHTGVTMIADGTDESDTRLNACLNTDSGIGIVRYAQAGYDVARRVADGRGALTEDSITVPLWWSPKATFGPVGA